MSMDRPEQVDRQGFLQALAAKRIVFPAHSKCDTDNMKIILREPLKMRICSRPSGTCYCFFPISRHFRGGLKAFVPPGLNF
jgi:hypothetical protein